MHDSNYFSSSLSRVKCDAKSESDIKFLLQVLGDKLMANGQFIKCSESSVIRTFFSKDRVSLNNSTKHSFRKCEINLKRYYAGKILDTAFIV